MDYNKTIELFAKVVKAKNQQEEPILYLGSTGIDNGVGCHRNRPFPLCVPLGSDGNPIVAVEDARVVIDECRTRVEPAFNEVNVFIVFDLVLFYRTSESNFEVYTLRGIEFRKTIPLCEFHPPLTQQELSREVDFGEVIVCNFRFDFDITSDPCVVDGTPGVIVRTFVFADIITKLTKFEDVLVHGRVDRHCGVEDPDECHGGSSRRHGSSHRPLHLDEVDSE